MSRHFQVICEHLDWKWAGEILIPAAGAANAPKLFDRKYELIKTAGTELFIWEISQETAEKISAPLCPQRSIAGWPH